MITTDRAAGQALRRYEDIEELLPGVDNPTPLVRIGSPGSGALYLKLEWMNPFGSVKDRVAARLLSGMEARQELGERDLVEPTSGNTGIALAALAARRGIGMVATIPDGVPEEKKVLLRMLGAEVWPTPDDLCPVDNPKDGAIALARALAASEEGERFAMPNQYANPDNVAAHYETTGPEIWRQTEGEVSVFVAGLGSCGTITGVGRYLKERNPDVVVVGIEPEPGHRLPGMKSFAEASEPEILDRRVIDEVIVVDDDSAYAATKRLWRDEGLMVGPSTGAAVTAAARFGDELAVAISPDSGLKYTTYFADILGDEGLPG